MKTILAMLGGAAIGATCALLYAPEPGKTTRARLRDKATRYSNDVQEYVEGKTEHLKNKAKGYRHYAEEAIEKAPDLMQRGQELLTSATSATTKASTAMSAVVDQEPMETAV